MPRTARPKPPPPGSIVRAIAPKPDLSRSESDETSIETTKTTRTTLLATSRATTRAASRSRQSSAKPEVEVGNCGVPQCLIPNCSLPTHLNYGKQRRLALRSSSEPQIEQLSIDEPDSGPSKRSRKEMQANIKLPIESDDDPEFQRLFNDFFELHFDRLVLIYRPQRRDPAYKQVVHRLAMHNPVYCLTLIAQAHMSEIKDYPASHTTSTTRLTDRIYSKLLQMMREKLESFDAAEVDVLLLAIVELCQYDLKLANFDALRSHQIGMTALVSKRGGIHNLGLSLPYVLRMDRLLAIRANQLPQFSSTNQPSPGLILRQSEQRTKKGSSFREDRLPLSEAVLSLCMDAAQLLELVDELQINFDPAVTLTGAEPRMEYFHYLRENIDSRHAVLNHSRASTTVSKDLAALTALKIVTYFIASANFLPIVTEMLASRLWNMLNSELSANDQALWQSFHLATWNDHMPMLLWLLFVCALPSSREGSLSFAARQTPPQAVASAQSSRRPSTTRNTSTPQSIVSPSSPRRQRLLPRLILHVAEHLVGERPLSGTEDWDIEVIDILESFLFDGSRLRNEYLNIIARVHEVVLARGDEHV